MVSYLLKIKEQKTFKDVKKIAALIQLYKLSKNIQIEQKSKQQYRLIFYF